LQQIEKFNSTVNVSAKIFPKKTKFSPSVLAVFAGFRDSVWGGKKGENFKS